MTKADQRQRTLKRVNVILKLAILDPVSMAREYLVAVELACEEESMCTALEYCRLRDMIEAMGHYLHPETFADALDKAAS